MRRYLVVANQTLGSNELYDEVRACLASGPCTFHIVVPATQPTEHFTWTEGEARALARDRLERALSWFRELPATVDGEVGDANPLLAIWDVLRAGQFDHIILIDAAARNLSLAEDGPSDAREDGVRSAGHGRRVRPESRGNSALTSHGMNTQQVPAHSRWQAAKAANRHAFYLLDRICGLCCIGCRGAASGRLAP